MKDRINDNGLKQRPVPSKRSSMCSISSQSMIESVEKRRSSLATSTPHISEAKYWWNKLTDDELATETEKWKHTVAAEARFLSRQPPDDKPKRHPSSVLNPGDSDMYLMPEGMDGAYNSLSTATRLKLTILSIIFALTVGLAINAYDNDSERSSYVYPSLVSAIAFYLVCSTAIQEIWHSPIQVSTAYLVDKALLPSVFSNFDTVEVEDDDGPYSLDVHYLHTKGSSGGIKIDAIYCNHGFGAWSLIWLPVMRKMAEQLRVSHVLSHDTVGFGLTSRPPVEHIRDLHRYGFSFSAGIGLALLERTLLFHNKRSLNENTNVVLIGHSMGSLTTLRMALHLPESTEVQVILVAPAVVGPEPSDLCGQASTARLLFDFISNLLGRFYALCLPFIRFLRFTLIDPPSYFLLKRTIAFRPFWHTLLWLCWGDKKVLTDNDVERYRWPSIVDGCVEGTIHFLRAQPFCHGFLSYPGGDLQLLYDVLERPNVRSVSIIQGTREPLTPLANARRLARLFPKIHLEELAGMGHDPIAESPDRLLQAVNAILKKNAMY